MTQSDTLPFDESILRQVLGDVLDDRMFLIWTALAMDPGSNRFDKRPVNPETGNADTADGGNSAANRGRMTFDEAVEAARRWGAGIGLAPGRCTSRKLIAVDIDAVFDLRDRPRPELIEVWTGGGEALCYGERSPSGEGLRLLLSGTVDPSVAGNGVESGGLGFYYGDSKFVTLTGAHVGGPLALREAPEVIDRGLAWMEALAATRDVLAGHGGVTDYQGARGLARAEADILSGDRLHEPTMFVSGYLARVTQLNADQIIERLEDLFDRSAARTEYPQRWAERRRHIGRWTRNAVKKFGSLAQQQGGGISEDEAIARLRSILRLGEPPPAEVEAEAEAEAEADMIAAYAAEIEKRRLAALRTMEPPDEGLPAATNYWEFFDSMPSVLGKRLADLALSGMKRDAPGAALLTALEALSIVGRNQYIVRPMTGPADGPPRLTPLNLAAGVIAPSGVGKGWLLGILKTTAAISGTPAAGALESRQGMHQGMLDSRLESVAYPEDARATFPMSAPCPATALLLDEWGLVLQGASGERCNPSVRDAVMFIMQALPEAMTSVAAGSRSDRVKSKPPIPHPYLTAFGLTTAEEFVLTRAMFRNGFATRHLIAFEDDESALPRKPPGYAWPQRMPASLMRNLLLLAARPNALGMTTMRRQHGMPHDALASEFVDFGLDGGAQRSARIIHIDPALTARIQAAEAALEDAPDVGEAAGRYALQTIKVAGLLALGDLATSEDEDMPDPHRSPIIIQPEHVDWALGFVEALVRGLALRAPDALPGAAGTATIDELDTRERVLRVILDIARDPEGFSREDRVRRLTMKGRIQPWIVNRRLRRKASSRAIDAALGYWQTDGLLSKVPEHVESGVHVDTLAIISDENVLLAYEALHGLPGK